MLSFIFVVFLSSCIFVNCLKELPHRARGGLAHKLLGDEIKISTPFSWQTKLDNFDSKNPSTFTQRYYVDSQFWDGVGPIFLYIGGEGTLNGTPNGYVATLAKNYSAMIVALEHRFYGGSVPNNDASTENYRFLTVDQALADLAFFTDFAKVKHLTRNSSWFVFGGSYPGALASWYRIAYPQKSAGSLSSSGVVNCIIDYYDFDMAVSAAIGNKCADQIRRINAAFERAIATPEGWQKSVGQFNCEADMWKEDFLYMIADSWSMADQYSNKASLCTAIGAVGPEASDAVLTQTFADFSLAYWGKDFCSEGFYNTEQLADPKRWEINSRSWRWQTCYEVSYFNTAPPSGSLRGLSVNMDYHLRQCEHMFGIPNMYPTSDAMTAKFGGQFPTGRNIFYSDFSDDPWARASVNYPVSSDQPYFLSQCDGCGHCKDLSAPKDSDPDNLKKSRTEFEGYMFKWLQEAKSK